MKSSGYYVYYVFGGLIIIITIICGFVFNVNPGFIVIVSFSEIVIFMMGIIIYNHFFNQIESIRLAIEKHSDSIPYGYSEGEIGKLSSSINNMLDELKETEVKQKKEKEFLRDIISDISHQIKTPVASLTVFNDILINEVEEKHRPMIEESGLQIERIKWLVLSMLQLARIEADAITFIKKEVSFKKVINSCIDILLVKAKEKNITFNICEKDVIVNVDEEWFKEALINILKNAIEYSPVDSYINIDIKHTPLETRIYLTDYGIGIPENERLNIFKRFYTIHSNKVNPNSVGIGLSLSKSIIEGMDGKIRVESKYKDECKGDECSYTSMVISFYN